MIEYKIPYDPSGNLGAAYRYAITTSNADWVALLDHDVIMMHPNWQYICEQSIKNHPDAGIFTCWTNRIGSKCQKIGEGMIPRSDKMSAHRATALMIWNINDFSCSKLSETTNKFSGFFLLIKRVAFFEIPVDCLNGFFGVDWDLKDRICAAGYEAYRIDGLYGFHLRDRQRSWIEGQNVSKNFNP